MTYFQKKISFFNLKLAISHSHISLLLHIISSWHCSSESIVGFVRAFKAGSRQAWHWVYNIALIVQLAGRRTDRLIDRCSTETLITPLSVYFCYIFSLPLHLILHIYALPPFFFIPELSSEALPQLDCKFWGPNVCGRLPGFACEASHPVM